MILTPFSNLLPYSDRLSVAWWNKTDDVNFEEAMTQLGTEHGSHLHQVHGGTVVTVDRATDEQSLTQADAQVTVTRGLTLFTLSADCQSFVCYAPKQDVAAVIHAGWKGLLARVIPHTVTQLMEEFTVDPSELLVGAAPSLCLEHSGFTNPVVELPGIDPKFFHNNHADLRAIADAQFEECGVKKVHMERVQLCTSCENKFLWSYRGGDRDQVQHGKRNMLGCVLR